MMHALTISVLLISEALCSCSDIQGVSLKLEQRGFIGPDTRRAMVYLTLRVCNEPESEGVDRWHELFSWRARLIPNREMEREYSRVVRQTHEGLRGRRART
jgi:hypothetical protein